MMLLVRISLPFLSRSYGNESSIGTLRSDHSNLSVKTCILVIKTELAYIDGIMTASLSV